MLNEQHQICGQVISLFPAKSANANVITAHSCSTWLGNPLRDGSAELQVGAAKEFTHVSGCGDGVVRLGFAVLIVLLCTAGGRLAVASCVRRVS